MAQKIFKMGNNMVVSLLGESLGSLSVKEGARGWDTASLGDSDQ